MSSGTEHVLGELRVALADVGDTATCLLHTILFARAPGPVRPSEATCQAFPGVAYALCSVGDVGRKVDQAVRALEDSLASSSNFHESVYGGVSSSTSGYGYGYGGARGWLVVTFFERKVKKALFGLMSNEEKVVCEKWVLPVQIVQRGVDQSAYVGETEAALQQCLMHILTAVQSIDHIPNTMYDFEIASFGSLEAAQSDGSYALGFPGAGASVRLMG